MTELDYQKLVSRADLRIDGAVPASDEGLPVGNGVMGTCVWTTPAALKFQINREDRREPGLKNLSLPRPID